MPRELGKRKIEVMGNLNRLGEGLRCHSGFGAHYVSQCQHIGYENEMWHLQKLGLCKITDVGESSFVRITDKGRAKLLELVS